MLTQSQDAQLWRAAVRRAHQRLWRHDSKRVDQFTNAAGVQDGVLTLQNKIDSQFIVESLSAMSPLMTFLEKSSSFLQKNLPADADIAALWGTLYVMIEVAALEENAIDRISRMVKVFGHKLELLNAYCNNNSCMDQLREAALDIHVELLSFFTHVISFLRGAEDFERTKNESWDPLLSTYTSTTQNIDETLQRIEKFSRLAVHVDEVQKLQLLLSLKDPNEEANFPCVMLPPTSTSRFYNRDQIIEKIDTHFFNQPGSHRFRSFTLYGLGGVGKSHVVLKYASYKVSTFDAILWIQSETIAALEKSFTDIALRLKIPGAEPRKTDENRIQVLSWLSKTTRKWLLIFDNAEDSELLLKYWPVAKQGCALITTRNHSLVYEPAETGIEVLPFDQESGSRFILHLLSLDIAKDVSDSEVKSASGLSERLSGHALAIAQMAALIHRRSWTIEEFLSIYDRNTRKMLGMSGRNSLDAVWKLSFESLDLKGAALLGVLSYIGPDSIPQALFEAFDSSSWPKALRFCSDEFTFSDALDSLLTLALIKRDKVTRTFSIHRLVQTQFRYYLSTSGRQEAFDNATQLLYEAFPQSDAKQGQLYDRWAQCQLYSQHVLSLKRNYEEAASSEPVRPKLQFCKLLKSLARFQLESASYAELEEVLKVAKAAFDAVDSMQQEPDLLADICASTGLMWAHRGLYLLAEPFLRQANNLRAHMNPFDHQELSWTEVNMANVTASTGQYEDSLKWQLKALRNRQLSEGNEFVLTEPHGLLFQNLGRSCLLLGRYLESHSWCHMAIGVLSESRNFAMLAYTHFVLGNLYSVEKNIEMARKQFSMAQNVWIERGQLRTHHFNGACVYKLGCIALELEDIDAAIAHLQESLIIAQLHRNVLTGDYARVLNKLSEALTLKGGCEAEAASKRGEAESILLARQDQSMGAKMQYDSMVYILWR